ncbi:hypothetical protein HMPREF2822_10810 [Corynebacterium sp. HMSC062E11]|uniref:hypothetical protein n=1 Tax=unclassified Corynebacterium TaxID=2624378 RepID=UPI0008A158B5|nr:MULTISPECIES: hypothetical protein [unclassified Corynebacterium]MDK6808184.1 hypothetical protein [Corynebacterium aurimucosum]NJJ84115.1 hypothetical protein [Corynebacterium aurimucosum]OFK27945.1 hypothetical protein HMPREF2822_10810 [Corynebacterium sp. HMSC062E11]OFN18227.1 hypothetical protein HMPREF2604_06850 [Corynebacterium sp. HMSC055A01]
MTFGNPQSPGTPQPGSPATPAPDYRYGQVSDTVRQARRAADMKAQWAPWPLKIVAVLEVFITSYTVYNICRLIAFENSPAAVTRTDQLSTELGVLLAVLVLLVCALTTYVLHAQQSARVALTVISAIVVLLIPASSVMPASIASAVVIVLLWLPANRQWFGGQAR